MAMIIQQTKSKNGPVPIIDEYNATTTYIGYGPFEGNTASAVWQIKKLVKNGTVTRMYWADGNDRYDNIWDNRTALTYL